METKSTAVAITANNNKNVNANVNIDEVAAKKRRGGVRLLKVALFMIRRRSEKSKSVDVASRGLWKRLVGSMRPLHLQGNPASPPPVIKNEPNMTPRSELYEDVQLGPHSPRGAMSSASSEDGMSRYASAVNLQELDPTNGEDEIDGDDMIDAKAEEFIAQFYEQMKLQRLDSVDRRYNEMIKRSIG
ncbi:hypothetical protein FNV43_RR23608 [Rhamnella rubrinervis]|uniref:Cotton fiber protein n=1 Tax=Rhamnella rubrinervis TaxID=2594499 RepID=A0A8K0DXF6_9ROSA|nr:hypothetical protein FNV43_RR23608 [Rhamnella rubrinervis]